MWDELLEACRAVLRDVVMLMAILLSALMALGIIGALMTLAELMWRALVP